jgi:hypothetical protein
MLYTASRHASDRYKLYQSGEFPQVFPRLDGGRQLRTWGSIPGLRTPAFPGQHKYDVPRLTGKHIPARQVPLACRRACTFETSI